MIKVFSILQSIIFIWLMNSKAIAQSAFKWQEFEVIEVESDYDKSFSTGYNEKYFYQLPGGDFLMIRLLKQVRGVVNRYEKLNKIDIVKFSNEGKYIGSSSHQLGEGIIDGTFTESVIQFNNKILLLVTTKKSDSNEIALWEISDLNNIKKVAAVSGLLKSTINTDLPKMVKSPGDKYLLIAANGGTHCSIFNEKHEVILNRSLIATALGDEDLVELDNAIIDDAGNAGLSVVSKFQSTNWLFSDIKANWIFLSISAKSGDVKASDMFSLVGVPIYERNNTFLFETGNSSFGFIYDFNPSESGWSEKNDKNIFLIIEKSTGNILLNKNLPDLRSGSMMSEYSEYFLRSAHCLKERIIIYGHSAASTDLFNEMTSSIIEIDMNGDILKQTQTIFPMLSPEPFVSNGKLCFFTEGPSEYFSSVKNGNITTLDYFKEKGLFDMALVTYEPITGKINYETFDKTTPHQPGMRFIDENIYPMHFKSNNEKCLMKRVSTKKTLKISIAEVE